MLQNSPDSGGIKVPERLFSEVKYYLIGNIDEKVQRALSDGGAKQEYYMSEMITHAIADDPDPDEVSEAKELFELTVVTSRWVTMSVKCNCHLPTSAFKLESNSIFSDMVVCPSQISAADCKTLWGLVTYHGGQCCKDLGRRVTHLVCTRPQGAKYERAMRAGSTVKVVTPDWFTKCVSTNGRVPEDRFHPRLLILTPPPAPTPSPPPAEPEPESLTELYDNLHPDNQSQPGQSAPVKDIQLQPTVPLGAHGKPLSISKTESSRTREALANLLNSRLQGKLEPTFDPAKVNSQVAAAAAAAAAAAMTMRPGIPTMTPNKGGKPQQGGSQPNSPRTLQNITNRAENKSPSRQKISQLVTSLNRPPRQMSPGRSALSQQLAGVTRGAYPPGQHAQDLPMYFGHDPIETIPKDMCFLGCVFYITDYQKMLSPNILEGWKKKIMEHGGLVDDSYSNRVTHLLCEHQKSDVFQMAVRDQKRLVTAHWLNDILFESRMLPPWHPLHIPSIYGLDRPCSDQILAVSNFQNGERARVKQMILALGATYTNYLTHGNSALICKQATGLKYQKAVEWRLPVVNIQWLHDLLLGSLEALKLPVHHRYQQFAPEHSFRLETWRVAHLMEGWKVPLRILKDTWKRFLPSPSVQMATQLKRKMEEELQSLAKRPRLMMSSPPCLNGEGAPIVLITGMSRTRAEVLSEQVERLGGQVTSVARRGVTHLVAGNVTRTVKFLTAISVVKHMVMPEWVEQSSLENKFLDETNFILKDQKAELELSFSLQQSMARAQYRPLFTDMTFYVTPSVIPSRKVLQEIVENAGGCVVEKRPSVRKILSHRNATGEPTFIVISNETDLHTCQDLLLRRISVYHSEFVMMSVLKQAILYDTFTLSMTPS